MQISYDSNLNILATAVLNFNMKTVSETFECLLLNQHITMSYYNTANCFELLHMQILCKWANFIIFRLNITVKYIASSLKYIKYIIYACVLNEGLDGGGGGGLEFSNQ